MKKQNKKKAVLDTVMAKTANLAELIEYADDSVVSKTIVDKPVGTITIFAFDAGQGLSKHQAPYDAVVQVIEGKAVLVIDGKEVKAETGELIVMPANVPHSVRADEKFKMLLTMIRA